MNQRRSGALLGYVSIFINIVIGLLFTPFLVRMLGQDEYGLFSIVGSFAAYLAIMDLGLSDTVVRYVVRYQAHTDREGEEHFLGIMSVIYGLLSLCILGFGAVIYVYLPSFFETSLTEEQVTSARTMFLIVLGNVWLTVLFNALSATIVAYQRFVLLRVLEMASRIVSTLALCAVLLAGHKAIAVVAVTATVNALIVIYKVVYALVKLKVRVRLGGTPWGEVFGILRFSSSIFIVVVVEFLYWKLDMVILGIMLSPAVVAVYAIGMSFNKYFMSFSTAISRVMYPKIVKRVEEGADGEELTDLLISISRIQALVLLLLLSGLLLFGQEFLVLWVGPEYRAAYWIMVVTLVPFSLEMIGNVRNMILQAKAIYHFRSVIVFAFAVLNVALTVVLVRQHGMLGAALATGLGLLLGYLATAGILQWKAGLNMIRYAQEVAHGILPAMLLCALVGVALPLQPAQTWLVLLAKVVTYTALYVVSMWWIGMNAYEKDLARGFVAKLLKRAK